MLESVLAKDDCTISKTSLSHISNYTLQREHRTMVRAVLEEEG